MPALFNANMKDQNEPFVNKIKQRIDDAKQRIDEQEKIPAISMLVIIIGTALVATMTGIVAFAL